MATSTKPVRAWTFRTPYYPSCLELSTYDCPTAPPNATSIVVRMRAVALNPVDIQLMNFPLFHLPGYTGPKIPCADFAGTVVAAGAASGFRKGDSVFGFQSTLAGKGALTEERAIDTATSPVIRLPPGWDAAHGAALPCAWLTGRTCIASVADYMGTTRKLVVLGGSSATGMHAVRLGVQRGWDVRATCSARNRDFVQGLGATVIDYTAEDVRKSVKAFKPDAIIDCVGGTECLGLAGRYVTIVGDKTGRETMGGPLTYYWTVWQNVRWARGRLGLGPVYDNLMLSAKNEYLEEATTLLKVEDIAIDSTFAFEDAKKGFERLNTGRARGKVIITIGESSERR